MKIIYTIVETREKEADFGEYVGYGLRCVCGEESAEMKNVSPHKESVMRLAEMLEREKVEPAHLFDVIYDLLSEGCIK